MAKKSLRGVILLLLLALVVCPILPTAAHRAQRHTLWEATQSSRCAAEEIIHSVAFSPDGNAVLANWDKGTARLWDVHTGTLKHVFTHKDWFNINYVMYVRFSPNGDYILTGSTREAKLWSARTGQELHTFSRNPDHSPDYRGTRVYFSPDSQYILTGGVDGATLWDVKTGRKLRSFQGYSERGSVEFSPDGRYVLTSIEGSMVQQKVRIWDVQTGKIVHEFEDELKGQFSPDGKFVFIPDNKGLALWDLTTYERLQMLAIQGSWELSPNGEYLLDEDIWEGNRVFRADLWKVATGLKLYEFRFSNQMKGFFLADGRHLLIRAARMATGPAGTVYILWDIVENREIARYTASLGDIATYAISPMHHTMLVGNIEGEVLLFNPQNGQIVRKFC